MGLDLKNIVKNTRTTYKFTPEQLTEVLAEALCISGRDLSLYFKIEDVSTDPMDRFGVDTVTSIELTLNRTE